MKILVKGVVKNKAVWLSVWDCLLFPSCLFQHEIRTVRQLRHPNIIQYMTSFTAAQQLWIIMPFLGYTSASRLVATHFSEGLPEPALALIVREILQGLSYLHSKNIIHRLVWSTLFICILGERGILALLKCEDRLQ